MHLKELELYGFKSFGDKVKIGFHPHLTAIVGPNGSGKSNIVDSVRWLLGDQSYKSLRIPSSEEVIFKGSDNGAPFNFSHVGMVIDLEDKGEVKVERRYHRSGENEYILNNKTVRLKDIRALLSSFGFGLGSLSILSQGQIDTILSLVPTDRRVILEEVAQITTFKENKTRILKKLDATRENLTRLEDICREVETRLKELGEQAEAAKMHRGLSHKKEHLEINISFKETERLVKNIRRNITELEDREKELFHLRNEIAKLEIEKNKQESELEELRNALEKELHKSKERSLHIEKAKSAMNLSHSELERLRESRLSSQQTISRIEYEIEELYKLILEENEKLLNAQNEKTSASNRIDELRKRHNQFNIDEGRELESINQRVDEISKLKVGIDLSTQRLSILEEQAERSSQNLEEGEEVFKDRTNELEKIRSRAEQIKISVQDITRKIESKQQENDKISKLLDEVESKLADNENKLSAVKDELIGIASELKVLEDLQRKYVGYQFGVKHILEAKNRNELTGIIGPVIDLIKASSGFEKAVESALGGKGQYLIVEKFEDGLKAVEYLKKSGSGKATFIPMEDFESENLRRETGNLSESDGFLGKVIDKVSVDEKYRSIVEYLLKDSLIFKNLQSARDSRKKFKLRQLIVTPEGDLHYHGGFFSGGSSDYRVEGPLVRRSRIEELQKNKNEKELESKSVAERINMARSLRDDHLRNIKLSEHEITKLREEKSAELSRHQYLEETINTLEKDIEELGSKRVKIGAELTDLVNEIDKLKKERGALEKNLDSISHKSKNDELRKNEISQAKSLREDEINRLKIHISSREQEESHLKSRIIENENKIRILNENLKSAKEEFLSRLGREEDAESRYIRLKYRAETEIEKLSSEEDSEFSLKAQIEKARDLLAQQRNNLIETQTEAEQIDAKRESQSLRVAKMEAELVSFLKKVAGLENIKKEYPDLLNVDSEDFERFLQSPLIDELPPRKQMMDELDEINVKLAEIGEVNVLAERDFENYQRRKTFLDAQKMDLVKSIDEAMETLAEIEIESKKAFKEVFELTKTNFEEIFQELFPNGKAELLLADPNDLLESGLEIKVKFPGKKELDLLQFSGGERSIIAIAFLFAVLKSKPPSFVILDEVEAALDDVNVEKFINLIKKFSDKFQFIIVTHNKLTMEYARELWGITMKKGGMSQVVNISLDEWLRQHPQEAQVVN